MCVLMLVIHSKVDNFNFKYYPCSCLTNIPAWYFEILNLVNQYGNLLI